MNNFIKINDYLINVNNIAYIEEKYDSAYEYVPELNENVKYHFMTSIIYFTTGNKLTIKGLPLQELEDSLTTNAYQPLYDKIIDLEKTVLALSRIATEYSENFAEDYQTLSNFINKKE